MALGRQAGAFLADEAAGGQGIAHAAGHAPGGQPGAGAAVAGQGLRCACLPHGGILSGVETIEKDAVGVQGAMLLQPRVKHARGVAQQDDQFDGAVRWYLCGPREAEVQDRGLQGGPGPALG